MEPELTTQESILIQLLAATDATWLPCRESHNHGINPTITNTYEARQRFRESGVAWASGVTSDSERKKAQRSLEDLARDGLVITARPNGTKTLFARLADDVYDRTRRKCGLTSAVTAFAMLKLVSVHSVRPSTLYQHVWIPETTLNGGRGWGDGNQNELFDVSQRCLPALVAGWLDTQCDSQRHVFYRIAASGWELLDAGWRPSVVVASRNNHVALTYWNLLTAERSKLATRTPEHTDELGWLPLPVCHHDMPYAG